MKRWIRGFVAVAAVAAMLIPSAAMAEPKGPEMVHAGTAPTASTAGRTITAQQLRQDSTLHGVYLGSPSSRGTDSRPDDARFTNIPVIRKLFTSIFDTRPSSDIQPEHNQSDVDGAKINNLTVKWLNGDPSNPSHMIANPSDDTSLSFPARVDFQISGNHDHQPGEVEFTLPLTLFKDAQGNDLGSISLSVPEDPASGSVFTYQRLGDRIVVRNAVPIPASYEGYFEFSYTDITPHLVPSGVESAPIRVILHDVGNNATAVQTTDPLTATVNTSETLLDAHKEGHFYENLPYLANLQPQNFDSSQYWYVDWYTSASVTGNRAFKLSVTDTPVLSGDDGTGKHISYAKGLIIGTDIPNATVKTDEQGNQTLTSDNAFSGYVQPGHNFFYHILMAYPLSDLPPVDPSSSGKTPVSISTAQNKITYALTPERDDRTQSQSAVADQWYKRYPYNVGNLVSLCKHGPYGYDDTTQSNFGCNFSPDLGENEYGLNQLASGKDFHTTWRIEALQQDWGLTAKNGLASTENYGTYPVKTEVVDDKEWFARQNPGEEPLSASELEVTSLDLKIPVMYQFKGTPASGYEYMEDPGLTPPNTTIQVSSGNNTWKTIATVSYKNKSITISPVSHSGASVTNQTRLVFPRGVTGWKATYTSKEAGEEWPAVANVTVHSAGRVQDRAKKLISQSQTAATDLANHSMMRLTQLDEEGNPIRTSAPSQDSWYNETAVQQIKSASQSATMTKDGIQTENDTVHGLVKIHYSLDQTLQTNVQSQAVVSRLTREKVFTSDRSGRFYDLLPRGVRANLSSIAAQGGSVTSTRIIENWRNTGRQMLIVGVEGDRVHLLDQSAYLRRLSFDASYSWGDIKELNNYSPINTAAYVSDSPILGTIAGSQSEPDTPDGGKNSLSKFAFRNVGNSVKEAFTGLEPGNRGKVSTLYASDTTPINPLTGASSGLTIQVAAQGSSIWTKGHDKKADGTINPAQSVTALSGGSYRYRLFVTGNGSKTTKDIVLFDNLEAYTPHGRDEDVNTPQWHGQLISVDTSYLKSQGIDPVVYYSTTPFDSSKEPQLNDGTWTTTKPDDMSTVKAIAIDARRQSDGTDYTLPEDGALQVQLLMRAPSGQAAADAAKQNAKAFNNVQMGSTSGGAHTWSHDDYTKVGIKPFNVTITKQWDDDNNRDALRSNSVEAHLLADGNDLGNEGTANLNTANHWTHTFTNMPSSDENGNMISYSAVDAVTGYSVSNSEKTTNNGLMITLTNHHDITTTSISGTKKWIGNGTRPDSLKLHLYADGVEDKEKTAQITGTNTDTWQWRYDNLPQNKNVGGRAVPIKYTVKEERVTGWTPDGVSDGYDHQYASGATITNRWNPYGNLALTKTAEDAQGPAKDATFTFTLGLTTSHGDYDTGIYNWTKNGGSCDADPHSADCSGTVGNGNTVTLKAGQTITVHDVPMGEKYIWTETNTKGFTAETIEHATGTVPDNETANAQIVNVYRSAGNAFITAQKVLTGRQLRIFQFGFTLSPVTGSNNGVGGTVGSPIRSAWNEADGTISFSALTYTQNDHDKDFWYEIKESKYNHPGYTGDNSVYRVKVEVKDKGDGTLSAIPTYYLYKNGQLNALTQGSKPEFTNNYSARGTLPFVAQKVLIGGKLADHHFTFNLLRGDQQLATATTNDAGVARFPDLKYTQDDAGKTFQYTVSEQQGSDPNIVWDTHTETVTVKVTDNGDGTLSLSEKFAGTVGGTPLVWRNQMGPGNLRISKELTNDAQTQAHKDTEFPMKVRLVPPAGGKLADHYEGTITGNGGAPVSEQLPVTNGTITFQLKGGQSMLITGIAGGTSYQVVEEEE